MIRFCQNPACGRGFVDVARRKKDGPPPMLCAMCRRGGKPLSRLVGGDTRERAEQRQQERDRETEG